MKYISLITVTLLLASSIHSQVKFDDLLRVYHKTSLPESHKALQLIPKFQLTDSLIKDTISGEIPAGQITAFINHKKTEVALQFKSEKLYSMLYNEATSRFNYNNEYARGTKAGNIARGIISFSNYEGAKIGSLKLILVTFTDWTTDKIIGYELKLYPYHED